MKKDKNCECEDKNCECEDKNCDNCYNVKEYNLALKIYMSYLREKHGHDNFNSPFLSWLENNICESN